MLTHESPTAGITHKEISSIAEEAYIFSFPMLMGYRYAFATFLVPALPSYRGPMNEMHGDPATLDPTFKDVITPNADTPYSAAALDLRSEPVVLEVPEVTDRYYVMQFEDLFGTNAHYVGSRATSTRAGTYLAVGPQWNGKISDGFNYVLRFETDLVFVIGRTQILGPDDVEDLEAVMSGYKLAPLSTYLGTEPVETATFDWPVWNDPASSDERFIGYVNRLLGWCQPTHPSEVDLMERFARIGVGAGLPFDADALSEDERTAIQAGVTAAREAITAKVDNLGTKVNGWGTVEALGSREFFAGDYLLRAAGAMAGWGGNDKIEAYYPMTREDSEGRPLDSEHRYRITMDTPPPVKAFWSITMYNTSYDDVSGYLVENPIERYLINSTTQGLVRGGDGPLSIYVQREEPQCGEGKANWLPAPEGKFYLAMRLYWPEPTALDGTWAPPPVIRV